MTRAQQIAIRLPPETLDRLDTIAAAMGKRAGGASITRSEALRTCLDRGLAILEDELISKPPPARKK